MNQIWSTGKRGSPCKIGRLFEPAKGRLLFDLFWVKANINLPMMSRGGSDNIIALNFHWSRLIKPMSKSKSKVSEWSYPKYQRLTKRTIFLPYWKLLKVSNQSPGNSIGPPRWILGAATHSKPSNCLWMVLSQISKIDKKEHLHTILKAPKGVHPITWQ